MDTTRSWRSYWKGDDQFAHTGQALSAYAGGTGGYSEGHWGGGIYGPSWKNSQVYEEMLVSAGGSGGIDTGSALLFKPSVGLEFQLTPKLSLQTGLGKSSPRVPTSIRTFRKPTRCIGLDLHIDNTQFASR